MMQRTDDRTNLGASAAEDASALVGGEPSNESERFLADLKLFVADGETLLRQARTLSGEGAIAARAEFERRLGQARRGYEAARTVAVDHAHDYMDRTETYVRNEPWKAIGVAALVGAIVGVALTRR